jgi:hypothetical protein
MTAVLLLAQLRGSNWGYTDAQPTSPTAIAPGSLPWHPISVGCALIIHLIIQTILLDPSKAVWNDSASNVSSLDPSGADQADAEHPTRNRKVVDFFGIDGTNDRPPRRASGHPYGIRAPTGLGFSSSPGRDWP